MHVHVLHAFNCTQLLLPLSTLLAGVSGGGVGGNVITEDKVALAKKA